MAPTKSEEKRGGKTVGIAIRKVSEDWKVMTITDEGTDRGGIARGWTTIAVRSSFSTAGST